MTPLLGDPVTLVSLAVALGGVLFLVYGWLRTRRTVNTAEGIRLVTSRYLGGKKVLTLVDVEGERLLLALSGDGVRLVAHLRSRGESPVQSATAHDPARAVTMDDRARAGEEAP